MKIFKVFIFLTLPFCHILMATEVDNFTDRDVPLIDSRSVLNFKMQTKINKYIDQTNAVYDCEESQENTKEFFYKNLNKEVGGNLWSKFELEIEKDHKVDKRHKERNESIYKYLTPINGFALYVAKFGSVINVGNLLVGTDKIGHFLALGKSYFDKMRNLHKSLKDVMEYGEKSERTYFGELSTSVFSYGDLVSNYEGLIFWQSLFGGEDPLVKCQNGLLVSGKRFDWLDYMSDAWDESINCNTYRNEFIKSKVFAGIQDNVSPNATCPLVKLSKETIDRYSRTPVKILNN